MEVVTIPPTLSKTDAEIVADLQSQLLDLHRKFRELCEPIEKSIVEIYSRYTPRYVIMNTNPAPEENHETLS